MVHVGYLRELLLLLQNTGYCLGVSVLLNL